MSDPKPALFHCMLVGEFGIIYKAYMQSRDGSAQEPVAVKALKGKKKQLRMWKEAGHCYLSALDLKVLLHKSAW